MGKSQKGRVATLSRTLQRVTTSLNESFALLDSSAPSASETLEWSEVKKAADLVSKHATTIGLLWTQSSLKVDEAEDAMKTLANSLQGLILLCHGYTVGAGPTLEQTIRNAVKGVLGASLSLLTSAVSFSVKGSSKEEREGALPAIVGCVWEACGVMKKTPFTNRAAIGRSLAQVATSVKDVLREIGEMRDGGKEVEDDGCGCGHAHEAPSGSHSHGQSHSHDSHNHGHGGHNHSHSHGSHNHSHDGPCGHDHSHGHGHDHSHSHGHDHGHSHGACGHDHSHEHVHDHSSHEDCGHEHEDGASSSVESLEFNDELSPEEIVVADATKGVVNSVLAFLKELLYVAADPQQEMDDRRDKTPTRASTLRGVVSLSHAMEKEAEFPAPLDPPGVDVSVTSDETTEAPQVATVVAKSTRPRLPVIFYRLMPKPRLKAVEQYIASFEYSLHPQTNFNSQKQRPLFLIMDTAKMIIASPQPIKCVEAVFVALFLTAGLPDVERYPLSFQTVLDDQVYQHIVLVIQHFGKFGAVGISRWPEFCSKDLKFHRMSSVIENYKTAYEEQRHVVEKIRVGLPVEHNIRSTNFVCWRHLELDLKERPWRDCVEAIDEFAAKGKQLWNSWIRSRRGEDPRHMYIRQSKRMHAGRESSPYKAKSLNSTVQLTTEVFENSESMDVMDTKIVNCRFNIQPPSSRESARIALSLEPGEVSYFWKKAPQSVLPKEFCFGKSPVAVRLPSKHGFTKFRRSKKALKSGGDAAIQQLKSARGAIRSFPRATQSQGNEAPLAVSQSIVGTKYLNATPGFDGPKACWECLRTLYRRKNEVRLLLLKDKLADLQMQGPSQMEAFRVVQDIFQQLVGIGEAITSRLDGFEAVMNALSANFDVVVESVNNQKELQSLKQLSKQLAEESLTEDQQLMTNSFPKVGKSRSTSPYLKKMGYDAKTHVHYQVPPCNWCGLHGHRMRDCQDLEIEIARRVRESKLRISRLTLPERSHGELKEQGSTEESTLRSVDGKVVLWHRHQLHKNQLHKNQVTELVPFKVQEQTGDSSAQPETAKKLELLPGGEDQHTTPKEKRGSKMSRKKRLVQRRLRTKLMYLLGK